MEKKPRSYGNGSLYKTSDNRWVVKVSLGSGPDGKPITKRFSARTKAEAEQKLRSFRNDQRKSETASPIHFSVQDYSDYWLKTYQFQKLKPLSFNCLEGAVQNHIFPRLGKMNFGSVSRDDIQQLINDLYHKEHLSYSSIKKVYNALNACYRHAQIGDVISRNPCLGVILPSAAERTKQIQPLSPGEIEILRRELRKEDGYGKPLYHYGNAFLLILNTGLRMGEALALQWSDVNFSTRTLTVNKNSIITHDRDESGNKVGGYQLKIQNSTKTSSSNRRIPLNQSAIQALYALKADNDSPFVIVNTHGGPSRVYNFERSFHVILREAGLPRYGVHALRHPYFKLKTYVCYQPKSNVHCKNRSHLSSVSRQAHRAPFWNAVVLQ